MIEIAPTVLGGIVGTGLAFAVASFGGALATPNVVEMVTMSSVFGLGIGATYGLAAGREATALEVAMYAVVSAAVAGGYTALGMTEIWLGIH